MSDKTLSSRACEMEGKCREFASITPDVDLSAAYQGVADMIGELRTELERRKESSGDAASVAAPSRPLSAMTLSRKSKEAEAEILRKLRVVRNRWRKYADGSLRYSQAYEGTQEGDRGQGRAVAFSECSGDLATIIREVTGKKSR